MSITEYDTWISKSVFLLFEMVDAYPFVRVKCEFYILNYVNGEVSMVALHFESYFCSLTVLLKN